MNLKKTEPGAAKQRTRRPHGATRAAPKVAVSTSHELDVRHDEIEPMATDIALFRKRDNPAVGGNPVPDEQHIHAADEPLGILLPPASRAMRRCGAGALLLGLCMTAHAQSPDVDRGRALYENHCQVCHTPKVHTRVNKIAGSRDEVRALVSNWQTQEKLQWSSDDINDVVEYLSRTRYQFP